jgi:hypothetical protein
VAVDSDGSIGSGVGSSSLSQLPPLLPARRRNSAADSRCSTAARQPAGTAGSTVNEATAVRPGQNGSFADVPVHRRSIPVRAHDGPTLSYVALAMPLAALEEEANTPKMAAGL